MKRMVSARDSTHDSLDYADDITLTSSKKAKIQQKTNRLLENRERVLVNAGKCKILRMNARNRDGIMMNAESQCRK